MIMQIALELKKKKGTYETTALSGSILFYIGIW